MSGSPKYSTVTVAPAYRQREEQRRREQQAARRRREAQRAKERAEIAARRAREAAARRERAKAAAERRQRELAARRATEQQAHASRLGQEQAGADARRLDEVRDLLARVRTSGNGAPPAELGALEQQLQTLRGRIGRAEQLGGAIEELRGRVVLLDRRTDDTGRGTDPGAVLAGFERRLAGIGPDAAEHDAEGRQRCLELLDRLRASAGPDGRTRFEALLGTMEHALTRHAATAASHVEAERQREQQVREARRQAEERAAAQAAADEAAAEAERERLAAALGEAADRLDVVHRSAEDAAEDARELADPELAGRIEEALRAVTGPLAAGAATEALTAVTALEELLPEAEARLDELQLAHTRRMDLGQALQDAMLGEGFAFLGGDDQGERLVLRFERPSGASYETTIATDTGGTPVLVYHVDGEPDVALDPAPEGAVCDRTEDLLERVHEAVGGQDGFVPGELTWQGKPPSRQARQLPGAEEWTWSR
ncbi:hypothetical protein [Streptomyces sp. SID5910]|uniref:hypothetical protein n=1 Tax=Streptomyces sp. SID5910 TaxID=2690312 RepID=UPI00136E9C55|nr:hypothetical protein [Streptomyces sp. SID5910]MYR41470.1 hypothetical protein [Streptomyces sp. SID5910]